MTDTDNNRVQQFTIAAPVTAPGSTCAALPAPARPPAPKLPTGPTPDGPQVSLRALRTSSLLGARTLPVRVGCDTGCAVTVRVALTPTARPPRGRKRTTVRLRTIEVTLPAGESRLLRPRVSRRAGTHAVAGPAGSARALRDRLRAGRGVRGLADHREPAVPGTR